MDIIGVLAYFFSTAQTFFMPPARASDLIKLLLRWMKPPWFLSFHPQLTAHRVQLKVPSSAKLSLPVLSNNKMCLWLVCELRRHEKSSSFTSSSCSAFYKVCIERSVLEISPFCDVTKGCQGQRYIPLVSDNAPRQAFVALSETARLSCF